MKTSEFRELMDEIGATSSRNQKKRLIADAIDDADGQRGEPQKLASILAGDEFDDLGISKKTIESCAETVFEDDVQDAPTVTEGLTPYDGATAADDVEMWRVYKHAWNARDLSGNDLEEYVSTLLFAHAYPSVIAFTLLGKTRSNESIGVSDTTVKKAVDDDYSTRRAALVPQTYDYVELLQSDGSFPDEPTVGRPFEPMLAKADELPSGERGWTAQLKLDGHRLLVHVEDGEATAITRRLNDVTESLPELNEIDWPDGRHVLDGEVIAEDGTYKSTSERVGSKDVDREQEMEFHLFDIVLHDGDDVSRRSYRDRYEKLSSMLDGVGDEHVTLVENHSFDDAKRIATEQGLEGIVAKNLDATYQFGKRSSDWRKDKNTPETVDAIVADVLPGTGENDGRLGAFELESADGESIGNVGTGFTDQQREDFWERRGELYGVVVEVTAEDYQDGLRFPSFERLRDGDGTADDIDRIEALFD